MSTDIVDDLHAAEDRIGLLEHTLSDLLECIRLETLDGIALDAARAVLNDRYERPSCDEDCDDEFCGSPRHNDQEYNNILREWEDTE